jgi:molecular chaperone HtpG
MKSLLSSDVAEVRLSSRLTDSPSVLVNQEGAMGANMESILKAANQQVMENKRVLEINPGHPMVKTLARLNEEGKTGLEPFAHLLLDHALITEGRLKDPSGFAARLQILMEKAAANL